MKKFIYFLHEDLFQTDDSVIMAYCSVKINNIIELETKLGETVLFFVACFSLTGILDDNNNSDLREKLLKVNEDICESGDFLLFSCLSDFLSFCLKKGYIHQQEYDFLSQFKFYYKKNNIIQII